MRDEILPDDLGRHKSKAAWSLEPCSAAYSLLILPRSSPTEKRQIDRVHAKPSCTCSSKVGEKLILLFRCIGIGLVRMINYQYKKPGTPRFRIF